MKNEFIKEITFALKTQVLRKTWFKVFVVVVLLLFGWMIYKLLNHSNVTIGEIGNEDVWESYEMVKQLETGDSEQPLEGLNSENIDTALNLFFFMAKEQNQNHFTSVIDGERLENDFGQFPLAERFDKYDEAMQRISRNKKLESIKVVRSLPNLAKNTQRIVLDIYYLDLENPIRTSVLVKNQEQYDVETTEGETFDIPYISSSIWELIEVIERGVDQ